MGREAQHPPPSFLPCTFSQERLESQPIVCKVRRALFCCNFLICAPHQLLSPFSAAVQRVFSIMRRTFHEQQDAALADMIRTSLMLQYNNRSDERLEDRRSVL